MARRIARDREVRTSSEPSGPEYVLPAARCAKWDSALERIGGAHPENGQVCSESMTSSAQSLASVVRCSDRLAGVMTAFDCRVVASEQQRTVSRPIAHRVPT